MEITPDSVGKIVTITGPDISFDRQSGIIMDVNSDMSPEDGPIAVFFDREVPDHLFGYQWEAGKWKGVATPDNYKDCPRVVCFKPEELLPVDEFSDENMVDRLFPKTSHRISSWKWPLVPDTHLCQLKRCESGENATMKTYINVWGTACVIYTCIACHQKCNGTLVDDFRLKDPLPGAPVKTAA